MTRQDETPSGMFWSESYEILPNSTQTKSPPDAAGVEKGTKMRLTVGGRLEATHFCQVRFLWRLAFRRLRRLCFDILRRRFFLRLPILKWC
jgi:hypothetical protein